MRSCDPAADGVTRPCSASQDATVRDPPSSVGTDPPVRAASSPAAVDNQPSSRSRCGSTAPIPAFSSARDSASTGTATSASTSGSRAPAEVAAVVVRPLVRQQHPNRRPENSLWTGALPLWNVGPLCRDAAVPERVPASATGPWPGPPSDPAHTGAGRPA